MHRLFVFVLLAAVGASQTAEEFRYLVKRDKFWGGESGILAIDENGIRYRSDNGKTTLDFAFADIRKADVSDPRQIWLYTYDRAMTRLTQPRRFEFALREGTTSSRLTEFLAAHLQRPPVGAYQIDNDGTKVLAYHRHRLGGCHGTLQFGPEAIEFESKEPKHSRTWVYKDIRTVGTMDPFNFRVTSYSETYSFDLKQRLSAEDYRAVWHRLYTVGFQSRERDGVMLAPQALTF